MAANRYDVVVVGARCAGSPLATYLARAGAKVAVVDKDTFPSDTLSTHIFEVGALRTFKTLGILDRLATTGAPFVTHHRARIDTIERRAVLPTDPDLPGAWGSIRRPVLDTILVDAAAEAGAEMRTGTRVTGLLGNGRVTGVKVERDGREEELHADLVVGADGTGSVIARSVGARKYHQVANERFAYWAYYEGVKSDLPTAMFSRWGDEMIITCPTDAGLHQALVIPPLPRLREFARDADRNFDAYLNCDPVISDLLCGARRVGPLLKFAKWTGYFRESAGPGWVLVGDAGHFKDPTPGQGISDALRQVDKLAPAILVNLGQPSRLDAAMNDWWAWRDDDGFEMHWFASDLGKAGAAPGILRAIVERIVDDDVMWGKFLDVFNHRVAVSELLTPGRLLGGVARTLRAGQQPARQTFAELRQAVGDDRARKKLRKAPVYSSSTDAAAASSPPAAVGAPA